MSFMTRVPHLLYELIHQLQITIADAAAIAGNAGHESAGFSQLQEMQPTKAGSRGGYGWFQWTGPRRKAFEKWCREKGYKGNEDAANIGFLIFELRNEYAHVIPKVRAAATLEGKVKAFELGYEKAGVKHYASRIKWAREALRAWEMSPLSKTPKAAPEIPPDVAEPVPAPTIFPMPSAVETGEEVSEPKPMAQSTTIWGAISMVISSGAFVVFEYITSWQGVILLMFLATLGFAGFFLWKRMQLRKEHGL